MTCTDKKVLQPSSRLRVVGFSSSNPRSRNPEYIMQTNERNEEGMGRNREKNDYGGFFVIQILVSEKREMLIG